MSNDIRLYEPDTDWMTEAVPMSVTAVMGDLRIDPREDDPDKRLGHGRSVQLTIGDGPDSRFVILTEHQVLDLIGVLSKRLACTDNFSATDWKPGPYRVQPDGTKEVIEEW